MVHGVTHIVSLRMEVATQRFKIPLLTLFRGIPHRCRGCMALPMWTDVSMSKKIPSRGYKRPVGASESATRVHLVKTGVDPRTEQETWARKLCAVNWCSVLSVFGKTGV